MTRARTAPTNEMNGDTHMNIENLKILIEEWEEFNHATAALDPLVEAGITPPVLDLHASVGLFQTPPAASWEEP